jgi:hypothetical protein
MKLKLTKFDWSTLKPGQMLLFQGRRNTGKTVLLRQAMFALREHIEMTIALTPTQSSAEMFRTLMPESCVYDQGFDVGVIESLLSTQRDMIKRGKRPRSILLVLDDCSFDSKAWKQKCVGDLARNGRHCLITVMITCQYVCDIGPSFRAQLDVCFALRDTILQNRKRLHSAFWGMMPFPQFCAAFDACTENFGALVLNQAVQTNEISSCVFHTRAQPTLPPFTMCRDIYFKFEKRLAEKPRAESQVEIDVKKRTV